MTDTKAITAAEFSAALRKTGVDAAQQKRIAVAVSGGGDSVALALLVNDWVKEHGGPNGGEVLALTVDHKLRPDSTAEAQAVQQIFRTRGIAHVILTWEGEKPATHIQERAREARYTLLLAACRARGFDTLAIAHNLEDQTETFWMRLAHGSGLDGLAAMAASRNVDGVTVIRPLLSFPRARLRATCVEQGVAWIEDPSNQNDKYLRVKLRAFEEALAAEGLTPARLALTLQKLEDAREALQVMAAAAFASCVVLYPEGYAALDVALWQKSPRDIQRRVLAQALSAVSPQDYPIGFEALEMTRLELLNAGFAGKTLAHCELFPSHGKILIAREAAVVEEPVAAVDGKVWDNRFVITGITNAGLKIGALGGKTVETEKTLPFKIRRVLPALWQDDKLCAVPHLGYYSDDCPEELKQSKVTFFSK